MATGQKTTLAILSAINQAIELALLQIMAGKWVTASEDRKARLGSEKVEITVCSFCRKSPDHIGKLVAGPDVFICQNCVAEACLTLGTYIPN